jgi:hypothetical protein
MVGLSKDFFLDQRRPGVSGRKLRGNMRKVNRRNEIIPEKHIKIHLLKLVFSLRNVFENVKLILITPSLCLVFLIQKIYECILQIAFPPEMYLYTYV